MKSLQAFAVLMIALSAAPSFADDEGSSSGAGNGGQGFLCHTRRGPRVYLRDLYEIEFLGDRTQALHPVNRTQEPVSVQIQRAVTKVRAVSETYAQALEFALAELARPEMRAPIPEGTRLPLTTDLGMAVDGRECETVQIANFRARLGVERLWYDAEWIRLLDLEPTDRAAFELHEATYKIERESFGATDSEHTRLLVGLMMSDGVLTADELTQGFQKPLRGARVDAVFRASYDRFFSPLLRRSAANPTRTREALRELPRATAQDLEGRWEVRGQLRGRADPHFYEHFIRFTPGAAGLSVHYSYASYEWGYFSISREDGVFSNGQVHPWIELSRMSRHRMPTFMLNHRRSREFEALFSAWNEEAMWRWMGPRREREESRSSLECYIYTVNLEEMLCQHDAGWAEVLLLHRVHESTTPSND